MERRPRERAVQYAMAQVGKPYCVTEADCGPGPYTYQWS